MLNAKTLEQTMSNISTEEINKQEIFKDIDANKLFPYLVNCEIRELTKNDLLIRAGEVNECLFLVLSGSCRVQLHLDQKKSVAKLNPGQCIGEITFMDHQPTTAFVVADTNTRILVIDESLLWKLTHAFHPIACNLLEMIAHRLRHSHSVINQIKDMVKQHEHDATVDPLTSLYNRRWLDKSLSKIMQRCDSNSKPLSVAMMDLDHFKAFNDKHGHLAGDTALSIVSKIIREHLRPEDMVTRFGGEEFFAILPGIDKEAARIIADRLCKAVENTDIIQQTNSILTPVTVSIGIAEMLDKDDVNALIHNADKALYKAKESGRNRVSH